MLLSNGKVECVLVVTMELYICLGSDEKILWRYNILGSRDTDFFFSWIVFNLISIISPKTVTWYLSEMPAPSSFRRIWRKWPEEKMKMLSSMDEQHTRALLTNIHRAISVLSTVVLSIAMFQCLQKSSMKLNMCTHVCAWHLNCFHVFQLA